MQLTKGAIGNLINRYKAVLKKCHLMNTFGSLAVAGMLVMGGAAAAGAATDWTGKEISNQEISKDGSYLQGGFINNTSWDMEAEELKNTKFLENKITITGSYLQGGIIKNTYDANLEITSSEFSKNTITAEGNYLQGGIINNDGASIDITGGTKFNNNTMSVDSYLQGGIINNDDGTININGAEFNENQIASSDFVQGGIILNEESIIKINDTKFIGNTVKSEGKVQGGIIINDAIGGESVIAISNSEFVKNKINSGDKLSGGIIFNDCLSDGEYSITVDSVKFSQNEVSSEGTLYGAIINNSKNHLITINSSSFEGNISVAKGEEALGGAIYNAGELKFTGINTFANNTLNGVANDIYNLGTITVADGTTSLGGGLTLADGTVHVTTGGTLDGKVTWVNGEKAATESLINVSADTTVLNGGMNTGENASASVAGVSVGSDKNVTLDGVAFTGNTFEVSQNNPIIGAVTANLGSDQSLTITDSNFESNAVVLNGKGSSGSSGGAAVSVKGQGTNSKLTITGSTFSGNRYDDTKNAANGAYGGAIGVQNASVTLTGVTLTGNSADSGKQVQGGGYYQSVGSLDATQLKVSDNNVETSSPLMGAGMVLWGTSGSIAEDSEISNNSGKVTGSSAYGGGLYLRGSRWGGDSNLKFAISDTTFSDNSLTATGGAYGGGLYVKGDSANSDNPAENDLGDKNGMISLDLTDVTFTNNTVSGDTASMGGALYIVGAEDSGNSVPANAAVSVTSSTFTGNKAEGASGWGGAIYNSGELTVNGGEFTGNEAGKYGGAIAGDVEGQGSLNITNATFTGNTSGAGGAIALWSDGIKDAASHSIAARFEGNTAERKGGAIVFLANHSGDKTVTASISGKFLNNSAGESGGAIHSERAELTITDAVFSGNSAEQKGGAIYNDANSSITFNGTNTFTNNTAAGKANDIYNAGTITVADGTTTLNSGLILAANSTTTVSGGALVINGTTTWEAKEGATLGSLKVDGGALTLQKGDVLEGYDKAKENTSLSVNSGSLYLINNSNYTATDFTAAKDALQVTNASFGFVGGTLVGADNKATDLVVSGNGITGDTTFTTAAGLGDTKVHNNSFLKNDLTVAADTNAPVTITGADVAVNKVNITGSATTLTINDGSLTVVGGNASDKLIANGTDALTTITVGSGKLNLGSAAMPDRGAGTLGSAEIALDSNGSLNASNGDYTVGNVTGGMGKVTANTGANLNTGTINANAVTADAANIKATGGDITAKTVTLKNNGLLAASKKDDTNGGNITISNALSGQGSVVADKTLTLTNGYAGADGSADVLTLQAGGDITAASDKDLTQANNGKLTVVAGGTIKAANISATKVAAKKLTASGDVAVDGGTLDLTGTDVSTVDSLKLTNGTQADIKGSLKLGGTGTGTGKTLTVGTGDDTLGGTTLSAKHINLNDGMLLVDPAWDLASSNVAVESMGTAPATDDVIVNGSVGVGRNSYLALGTADTGWLPGVVGNYTKGVGLSETGITAALGVFKGIEIAAGKNLTVDGSKTGTEISNGWTPAGSTPVTNTAEFANNSLLVVNGADADIAAGNAAISFEAPGTLKVAEGAKLLVTDAVAGQTYTIVGNVNNPGTDLAGWKNNGMTSTTDMISLGDAEFDNTNKKVTTSAVRNDAHTVFPNLSDGMANAVNDLYTGRKDSTGKSVDYADVNSADMGVRFLSRATDNRFLGMDKNAAAESIESAARIAFAGAVPQMTKMASDAGTNAVVNRLGFADPADGAQAMDADGKIVDRNTTGFALWIAPLWQSQHGWGMDADSMDYGFNGNLGGVSLGADYTFENAIRAGITFNIGGGYAESSGGDLSSTDNRMNFWGLGAYAGWNYENFGVMADVSYTSTWNDLKQDVDSRMGMGDLEADVQATAISAGLRAEYLLQTSAMDIIPHIGVRYMSLNTWGYDVDTHGGTVLEGDSLHQDIWTFPIGVTFSKDFALDSGWNFKPSLDFSVIPAAGDIKAKHDVHFTGLPGTYEVETQMMDYLTWQGGVGLELANDNMSIGVNYTLQAGQHTTGHGVFGSFRYEF